MRTLLSKFKAKVSKRCLTVAVALAAIPVMIGITPSVAGATNWVQQDWALVHWGSVQVLRDYDALNHWTLRWYAPGDGVPNYIVAEIWTPALCNYGHVWSTSGSGTGSGTFLFRIRQLPGATNNCYLNNISYYHGVQAFIVSNNCAAGYWQEGSIDTFSVNGEIRLDQVSVACGNPAAEIQMFVNGYNA